MTPPPANPLNEPGGMEVLADETLEEIGPGLLTWNVSEATRHALVTTAIGSTYLRDFIEHSLLTWKIYAKQHGLGIVVFSDGCVPSDAMGGLNGSWFKMLSPELISERIPQIERIALVDTDIIINPMAPNLFDATPAGFVGVVPEFSADAQSDLEAKKRLSFLRNKHYDAAYPLDSFLFASAEQLYAEEGFEPLPNSFCAGLLVLDLEFASHFSAWFSEAKNTDQSRAVAWEQTYLNHKVLSRLPHHWLDSRFQAIWNLEMAKFHPSLYQIDNLSSSGFAESCVADTLNRVFFLHFAGSWPESGAWKNSPQKVLDKMLNLPSPEFVEYLAAPSTGVARGKLSFQPD